MGKDNELMTAVKENNQQNVRKILQKYRKSHKKNAVKKSNINLVDADGFTVLHHAALNGDVEIVMAIIEMEGDPKSTDQQGMTPLHLAAWAGKDGSVKALLENRALPNLPSLSGDTPLHLAAQHGYAACTKILLSFHADGTFRNDNKETPLDLACQFGHTAVVKQLSTDDKIKALLMSSMADQRYKSPLHLSAKSGHDDIVHLLLQGGANVNEVRVEGTPLHQAALYGKTDVVRLLLRAGADASIKNSHGLMPLDLVNRFTTSRAGLEIKQMLREAVGDHVAYARAVSDYHNQYDDTCLSFKVGDSIAVLEQNENGRWQGYVVNTEMEKIGYFPSMAVHLIGKNKQLPSTSSAGSQTSMESGSGGSYPPSAVSTPDRRSDPAISMPQPVGVVPIGSFEVVTLAQANPESHAPPKQTACGSVPPRMSSFKQRKSAKQSPGNSPSLNKSRFSNHVSPTHKTMSEQERAALLQRSKSEEAPRKKNELPVLRRIDPNILNRLSPLTSPGQSPRQSPGQSPVLRRSYQGRNAQYDLANTIRQHVRSHTESTLSKSSGSQSTIYADVNVIPSRSPSEKSSPSHSNYNTAFYCDNNNRVENSCKSASASNTDNESVSSSNASYDKSPTRKIKPILVKSRSVDSSSKTLSASDTEGSTRNGNSVKFAQSPEEKHRGWSNTSYETMHSYSGQIHSSPKLNQRPALVRSYTEITPPRTPNYAMTIRRAPKKRNSTDAQQESVFSFPTTHSNTSSSSGQGNVSPRNNGSPKTARPFSSPEPHGSWSSSKTSGSSSPRSPESLMGGSSPSSSSLSPMTPVFHDEPKYSSNQKLNEEDQKVLDWLVDLKLASYIYNFQSHGFDMTSIRAITPEDLNIMDIKKTGHRKKLLSEVAKLPPANDIPKIKPDDVGSWLANLNLQQYEQNFFEGGFDDIDFLKDLDKNDLDMIDIKKKGHQKKILMAVQQLSDMELTAILDEVVAETPIKRGVSVSGRTYSDQILNEFFPSNFPNISKVSSSQYPSQGVHNSEETASDQSPSRLASSSTPKENMSAKIPPPVARKTSSSNAPKTKPKPSRSYTNGYSAQGNSSSCDSINDTGNLRKGPLNSSGEIQGDQDEVVLSSKSRNFFKEQERKLSTNSNCDMDRKAPSLTSLSSLEESPSNTIKRNGSIPPPFPKLKSKIPLVSETEKPIASSKPPPPAPPKRLDSIRTSAEINGSQIDFTHAFDISSTERIEEAPALPRKVRNSSESGSVSNSISPSTPASSSRHLPPSNNISVPENTSCYSNGPSSKYDAIDISFQSPSVEVLSPPDYSYKTSKDKTDGVSDKSSPKSKKDSIDEAFGSTDNLLSDLMADIDDFSAQLDAMF